MSLFLMRNEHEVFLGRSRKFPGEQFVETLQLPKVEGESIWDPFDIGIVLEKISENIEVDEEPLEDYIACLSWLQNRLKVDLWQFHIRGGQWATPTEANLNTLTNSLRGLDPNLRGQSYQWPLLIGAMERLHQRKKEQREKQCTSAARHWYTGL